jgi:hypothetical protein
MSRSQRRAILLLAQNLSIAGDHVAARKAFALVGISYVPAHELVAGLN